MKVFNSVLVFCDAELDDPAACDGLLDRAAWIAAHNHASITLFDVVTASATGLVRSLVSTVTGDTSADESLLASRRARLEGLAETLRGNDCEVVVTIAVGVTAEEIVREVIRTGHDLLLTTGAKRPPAGKPAHLDLEIVRKCPCPVWFHSDDADLRQGRILAAVDPDPEDPDRDGLSLSILNLATRIAAQSGAGLDVLSVWRFDEASTLRSPLVKMPASEIDTLVEEERQGSALRLARLVRRIEEVDGGRQVLHLEGDAAARIAAHVDEAGMGLLVLGSVARSGIQGLLIGNTAETLLGRIGCSILVVKPAGFVSPVPLDDKTERDGSGWAA